MPTTDHALDDLADRLALTIPAAATAVEHVSTEAPLLDSETRARLAVMVETRRTRRMTDADALDAMHALMSGHEWHAGTIETVAELLAQTGRAVAAPEWH